MSPILFVFAVLVVLGMLATAINDALIEGRWWRLLMPLLLFLVPVAASPFLVRFGMQTIHAMAENPRVLEWLSLFMITEALLSVWLGMTVIRCHYDGSRLPLRAALFFLPSSAGIAGLVWLAYSALYRFVGMGHLRVIASVVAAGVLLVVILGTILRLAVRDWGERLELKMLLMLVQLLAAAFIPVVMRPMVFMGEPPAQSPTRLLVLLVTIVVFAALGWLWWKWMLKREWRKYGIC